jgi:two-component system nitrate/nitrite response regulator NarL
VSEPIRVLVADDHPLFLDGLVATLGADEELEVVGVARDADSAVALATSLGPDLALLDITMPGDGLTAARRISEAAAETRVVMLTSSENHRDLVEAMEAGARAYMLKGIAGRELCTILKTIHAGGQYVSPGLAFGAIRGLTRPSARDPLAELTSREREVLALVGGGLSNAEVGGRLGIAEKTVKHYMTAILGKLGVVSRVEAALIAFKAGLVTDGLGGRDHDGAP